MKLYKCKLGEEFNILLMIFKFLKDGGYLQFDVIYGTCNNRGFSVHLCQMFGKILPRILCDGIINKDMNKWIQ